LRLGFGGALGEAEDDVGDFADGVVHCGLRCWEWMSGRVRYGGDGDLREGE